MARGYPVMVNYLLPCGFEPGRRESPGHSPVPHADVERHGLRAVTAAVKAFFGCRPANTPSGLVPCSLWRVPHTKVVTRLAPMCLTRVISPSLFDKQPSMRTARQSST